MADWGAVQATSKRWTSTGIMRVDFQRPHGLVKSADYDIFCQPSLRGQTCIVTGMYSTYFTVEVRNSSGALANLDFAFLMVGDNF